MNSGGRHKYLLLNLHQYSSIGQSVHTNIIPSDSIEPQDLERIYLPKPSPSYI